MDTQTILEQKSFFKIKLILAFGAIYIIWGTTFLAIRFAIATVPPLLMAGMRFATAGLLLFLWCTWRYRKKPSLTDWKNGALSGILMLFCGNGSLSLAEQYIPSGFAALICATIPIWMVLFQWKRIAGRRTGKITFTGIGMGFVGVVLLIGLEKRGAYVSSLETRMVFSSLLLLCGTIAWAAGSLYSRHAKTSLPLLSFVSLQMLAGGFCLLMAGSLRGEWSRFYLEAVSFQSIAALVYLIVFGALITFASYNWLLKVSTPAKVGTYAFFNPLVAVFLGWVLADEAITLRIGLGAAAILTSLVLINRSENATKEDEE
jgi:drug/metabolite transporter (DMT)-like permease